MKLPRDLVYWALYILGAAFFLFFLRLLFAVTGDKQVTLASVFGEGELLALSLPVLGEALGTLPGRASPEKGRWQFLVLGWLCFFLGTICGGLFGYGVTTLSTLADRDAHERFAEDFALTSLAIAGASIVTALLCKFLVRAANE
jgi:hypothetical protein